MGGGAKEEGEREEEERDWNMKIWEDYFLARLRERGESIELLAILKTEFN